MCPRPFYLGSCVNDASGRALSSERPGSFLSALTGYFLSILYHYSRPPHSPPQRSSLFALISAGDSQRMIVPVQSPIGLHTNLVISTGNSHAIHQVLVSQVKALSGSKHVAGPCLPNSSSIHTCARWINNP